MGYFQVLFRQLRMTFFHKIMVAENFFSSNAYYNFEKSRTISKCKNDEH